MQAGNIFVPQMKDTAISLIGKKLDVIHADMVRKTCSLDGLRLGRADARFLSPSPPKLIEGVRSFCVTMAS